MSAVTVNPIIELGASFALSYIFLHAAWVKISDLDHFMEVLRNYEVLPSRNVRLSARVIPALELLVGIGLLAAVTRQFAASWALVLLGIYTLVIGLNIKRGRRDLDCGCGGVGQQHRLTEWLYVRNGSLIALSLVLFLPVAATGLKHLIVMATGIGMAALVCLLYSAMNLLISNHCKLSTLGDA